MPGNCSRALAPTRRSITMLSPSHASQVITVVALLAAHGAELRRRCRRVGLRDEADDLFSEVCLIAWRRIDDLVDPPDSEGARRWLHRIMRLEVSNQHRASNRRRQMFVAWPGSSSMLEHTHTHTNKRRRRRRCDRRAIVRGSTRAHHLRSHDLLVGACRATLESSDR